MQVMPNGIEDIELVQIADDHESVRRSALRRPTRALGLFQKDVRDSRKWVCTKTDPVAVQVDHHLRKAHILKYMIHIVSSLIFSFDFPVLLVLAICLIKNP